MEINNVCKKQYNIYYCKIFKINSVNNSKIKYFNGTTNLNSSKYNKKEKN